MRIVGMHILVACTVNYFTKMKPQTKCSQQTNSENSQELNSNLITETELLNLALNCGSSINWCISTYFDILFDFRFVPCFLAAFTLYCSCIRAIFRRRPKYTPGPERCLCAPSPSSASTCLPEQRALTEERLTS